VMKLTRTLRQAIHELAARPIPRPSFGAYESTLHNILAPDNARVLVMGTGKASQFHNAVAQKFGTNIVGAVAPGKGGHEFLGKPVYGSLREGVEETQPYAIEVFVPPRSAADAIIDCVENETPLIVSLAEGIPTHDQLRVQSALRSQPKSRLMGANCPGMIIPSKKLKLGIQPLHVHSPGRVGLASRSGTISYELAAQTTALGLGQSIVCGLGGDMFPGTRTWEALQLMLDDDRTEVICLVGEIGGQMEEEAAAIYTQYLSSLSSTQRPKPVVGFIAGQATRRGLTYGHAGAIWWDEDESAARKKEVWEKAGFRMARTIGDIGGLIKEECDKLNRGQGGAI